MYYLKALKIRETFFIGQFYRCSIPLGGLIHAVVNRIWGRKCKIFTRKLSDLSYLFHIPDDTTRNWVLQRGLWHVDHCLMFVAPWSPTSTLSMLEISMVPVWVTLKNIPNQLYSIAVISHIAYGLGAPMATSKPRLDPTLMGEAKILVEIELNKPFPQKIATSDKNGSISMVNVEYSWIPSKCGRCGHLGHKKSRCLQTPMSQVKTTTLGNLQLSSGVNDSSPSKTNVAPTTTPSPGIEIAIVSKSNLEINSHYVSTPQIETTIAKRNVSSPHPRSKEISSIEEDSTTIVSEVLMLDSEPITYCDVVDPMISDLSNVVSSNVTSTISVLPPLDGTFVQYMTLENLGTDFAVLEGDFLQDMVVTPSPNACGIIVRDNGVVTPQSSDKDVDLVVSSSQRTLRDRPVLPFLKYNENEWISITTCRRSKRSRGCHGNYD